MKLSYTFLFVILSFINIHAQLKIGNQNTATHPSAILEVTSENNKGILFPRVEFTSKDLTSTTSPVQNPTDGLMIFNPVDTFQPIGYYLWFNNSWNLISSNSNRTSDLLMKYNSTTSKSFTPTSGWSDLSIEHFKTSSNILVNSIMAQFPENNNLITLSKGSYLLTLTLNVSTTEGSDSGIAGGRVHTHSYKMRIVDENGNSIPGAIDFQSVVNSASAATPKHLLIARVTFDLETETNVKIQIARDPNNSTYTGAVSYTNGSLHFLKASK